MPRHDVTIAAPDGAIDASLTLPEGGGSHPGVVMIPDAFGPRPVAFAMAQRLADAGYAVLLPNPYYRIGPAPMPHAGGDFTVPAVRDAVMPMMATLTPERVVADGRAALAWLAQAQGVRPGACGAVGYCMGGSIAMRLAAACPQQVAAAASYHGGRLATDAPDSPHRLLATATAELYFGHADQDESMNAAAIAELEAALDAAGTTYTSEVYEGAPHGFAVPGSSRYREDAAERHWRTMLALFDRALG